MPIRFWAVARRKLAQLNAAGSLDSLRIPPGNRLEALLGDQAGQQAFESMINMEAQFWLNLQLAWNLFQVMHSPAAVEIATIQRLPALMTAPVSEGITP